MFVKIENKERLINVLSDNKGKKAVIHFECHHCRDEQVTDAEEITSEMIDSFEKKGYMPLGIPCTECEDKVRMLDVNHVRGIELD